MDSLILLKDSLASGKLHELKGALNKAKDSLADVEGPSNIASIYMLRNHTIGNFSTFLEAYTLPDGISLKFDESEYDNIMQEILDRNSKLYKSKPDIVVVSLVLETFCPNYLENSFCSEEIISRVEEILNSLSENLSTLIICNTFLLPTIELGGIFAIKNTDSIYSKICRVNQWLQAKSQSSSNLYVSDWNQIEQRLGEERSRDQRFWYMAKSMFSNNFQSEYAKDVFSVIRPLKGMSRKCLVLDCDNTLWGGIVGEDGLAGIKLSNDSYDGRPFFDFQSTVLSLYNSGVLLAIVSKNNEEDVLNILDNHESMILKREHFVSLKVNWENKVQNISEIASELNLGLSHFVFIDDSDFECNLVSSQLPEVSVLQVPKDIYSYPSLISRTYLFSQLSASSEDTRRTQMYVEEQGRKQASKKFNSIDEYIESLEICLSIDLVKKENIPRVAQLTQKTNQFNLTTKRYAEADINSYSDSPNWNIFSLSVKDRFGDYGLTGVLMFRSISEVEFEVDSFLLSCRILGRGIEERFFGDCVKQLKMIYPKLKQLKLQFHPTKKNAQVMNLWEKFECNLVGTDPAGNKNYKLDV